METVIHMWKKIQSHVSNNHSCENSNPRVKKQNWLISSAMFSLRMWRFYPHVGKKANRTWIYVI